MVIEQVVHNERQRIWLELCKGENETAFSSTIELDSDEVYNMIFKNKSIK